MLESGLYFALGFLSAAFLALMVAPAIWRRAVVLTRKRIESSVPLTLNEIQADKDQLRAEFAMSARRLEMSLEELKEKAAEQMIELNRKRDELADLADDHKQKLETITELEARGSELRSELRQQESTLERTRDTLREAEDRLEERAIELDEMERRYRDSVGESDGRKIELVAKETELAALSDKLDDAGRSARESESTVGQLKSEIKTLKHLGKQEQRKVSDLEKRLTKAQTTLADREDKLERRERDLAKRREELSEANSKLGDSKKEMAKADSEKMKLEAELAKSALRLENLLKDASGENIENAVAEFEKDKKELQRKLAIAERERETLKVELSALSVANGDDWEVERRENAVLRERINDLAAQVTSMTATLEGNGSVIDEILNIGSKPARANGKSHDTGDADPGSLADRIRALQDAAQKMAAETKADA
ncbi:MAG: hypothetical protein AAF468_05685 [Pseudomonadota bacterium]